MKKDITHLTIILTNQCNLNCYYCFAHKNQEEMSIETAKKTVDFLLDNSGEAKHLNICFFGGEPLLMFDLIKETVFYGLEAAKSKNKYLSFSMTTNGTLFTEEIVDFFWKYRIGLLFSWDGTREMIEEVKGKSGYEKMASSLKMLQKRGFNLTGRVTVNPESPNLVLCAQHMKEVGFNSQVYAPMSDTNKGDYSIIKKSFYEYASYFIEEIENRYLIPDESLIRDINRKFGIEKVYDIPCDMAISSYGITCDGTILPCHHQETWGKDFQLGTVFKTGINEEKIRPFKEYARNKLKGCDSCFARPRCNGSCLKANYDDHKDIETPAVKYCEYVRARYLAVEKIYDELYNKNRNLFFIKEMIKRRLDWFLHEKEKLITPDSLKNGQVSFDGRDVFFDIQPSELNAATGKIIIDYLSNRKGDTIVTNPIPRCVFGSDYSLLKKRYGFKKEKVFTFLKNINKKSSQSEVKNMGLLLNEFISKSTLYPKCRTCVYRLRNECDYCYLGIGDLSA